ncbi:MAG: arginyltransferase [Methylovulum sp.]|nr:arginyltransferase [Methylovulum sp.]MCF7998292.1 arginyltransferase [Methylovulum sp.]
MNTVPLVYSQAHTCSYLENKLARSAFVHPGYPLTTSRYAELLTQGFRRSGDMVYKPTCGQCVACLSSRVPITQFKPSRSQKRCWLRNAETVACIKPPIFEQTHYDMYLRYQALRHAEGEMADIDSTEYMSFLGSAWCDTQFVEFSIAGELAGVAVIDCFDRAWSAVYTFFEPKFSSNGLGTYAVLWQIEQLRLKQLDFLYLGYWIQDCKKMAYKRNYQPMQILMNNEWQWLCV